MCGQAAIGPQNVAYPLFCSRPQAYGKHLSPIRVARQRAVKQLIGAHGLLNTPLKWNAAGIDEFLKLDRRPSSWLLGTGQSARGPSITPLGGGNQALHYIQN